MKTLRADIVRWNKENKGAEVKGVWKMNKASLIEHHKEVCQKLYAIVQKEVDDDIKEEKKVKKVRLIKPEPPHPDLLMLIKQIEEANKAGIYPYVECSLPLTRGAMEMGMDDYEVLMSRCENAQKILNAKKAEAEEKKFKKDAERCFGKLGKKKEEKKEETRREFEDRMKKEAKELHPKDPRKQLMYLIDKCDGVIGGMNIC